jgi:hypothetical protein
LKVIESLVELLLTLLGLVLKSLQRYGLLQAVPDIILDLGPMACAIVDWLLHRILPVLVYRIEWPSMITMIRREKQGLCVSLNRGLILEEFHTFG